MEATNRMLASFEAELGGTDAGNTYDQITVTGAATLDGNLKVRLVNGFTPAVGQTFRLLTAASISGSFASVSQPSNAGVSITTDATGVTATITSVVANAPVITSPTTAMAQLGGAFNYQISATNSPTAFDASNLPQGLSVDAGGHISGTPTTAGNYLIPITASNAAGTGNADLNIIVDVGLPGALHPSQLLNIATRLRVQSGDNALIGGFIITGTDPKQVLIRGIGPSLAQFFSGSLADPTLELYQGNTLLATNDNWRDSEAEIAATGIPPTNDLESAIVRTLGPGAYTAVLRGKGDTTGIGVVEAYDLNQAANSKLANIATRGFVDSGDNVMIGGFIIGPASSGSATVVVRVIGPSLSNFGVSGALQDPTIELHDGNGATIAGNDNWADDPNQGSIPPSLTPTDPHESALYRVLAPGNYTAIVRGRGDTTGIGLVEVYNL